MNPPTPTISFLLYAFWDDDFVPLSRSLFDPLRPAVCLNKPYADGGYENSTRVLAEKGWKMQARSSVSVDGKINDPSVAPQPPLEGICHSPCTFCIPFVVVTCDFVAAARCAVLIVPHDSPSR